MQTGSMWRQRHACSIPRTALAPCWLLNTSMGVANTLHGEGGAVPGTSVKELTVFSPASFCAFMSVRQMAVLPHPAGPSRNALQRTTNSSRSWLIFRQKVSSGW